MNKGILNGIGAYVLWGLFPIYWKLLHKVPPEQIIGHRIAWSFILLTAGVIYLTAEYGRIPWIAIALAFSFGFYGLVKKIAPLDPSVDSRYTSVHCADFTVPDRCTRLQREIRQL